MPLYAGNGSVYPSAQTTIGISLEAVVGTPYAGGPTHILPVKAPKYKPDLMLIPDDTLQGSMVPTYDLVTGLRYDAHGWNAPPYLDSFPNLIACEFGSADNVIAAPTLGGGGTTTLSSAAAAGATTVNVTAATGVKGWTSPTNPGTYISIGSATPNGTLESHQVLSVSTDTLTLFEPLVFAHASGETVTGLTSHMFSLLNNGGRAGAQPPSATIVDYDGEEWRQITAAQLDELTLKGNGTGLCDYTCTWFGNPATENISAPSLSAQDTQTPAPWTFYAAIGTGADVALGSLTYSPTIIDWEFDWKRGVVPIPALTGQQAYFAYFANVLQNSGKLTFIEQPGSPQLNNFLAAQRMTLNFSLFDMKTGWAFNVHASNAEYKTGEIDRTKEYVTVPVTYDQLPSTTDLISGNGNTGVGPCIVTIANTQTTSYWEGPSESP